MDFVAWHNVCFDVLEIKGFVGEVHRIVDVGGIAASFCVGHESEGVVRIMAVENGCLVVLF
jgi:hypothetical protein